MNAKEIVDATLRQIESDQQQKVNKSVMNNNSRSENRLFWLTLLVTTAFLIFGVFHTGNLI
jgi:hypothetical protein